MKWKFLSTPYRLPRVSANFPICHKNKLSECKFFSGEPLFQVSNRKSSRRLNTVDALLKLTIFRLCNCSICLEGRGRPFVLLLLGSRCPKTTHNSLHLSFSLISYSYNYFYSLPPSIKTIAITVPNYFTVSAFFGIYKPTVLMLLYPPGVMVDPYFLIRCVST